MTWKQKYGVAFDYTAKKVSSYYEITSPSTSSKPGAIVSVGHLENGQTFYRDYGSNRIEDDDDILTYYTFDYAGRSANVYTTGTPIEFGVPPMPYILVSVQRIEPTTVHCGPQALAFPQ